MCCLRSSISISYLSLLAVDAAFVFFRMSVRRDDNPNSLRIPYRDTKSDQQLISRPTNIAPYPLSSRPECRWACGPPKAMKNGSCSATTLPGSAISPLVIPTEAQRSGGTCGSAVPPWKCFSKERSVVERTAVSPFTQSSRDRGHSYRIMLFSSAMNDNRSQPGHGQSAVGM
jgi:hypothetical protein